MITYFFSFSIFAQIQKKKKSINLTLPVCRNPTQRKNEKIVIILKRVNFNIKISTRIYRFLNFLNEAYRWMIIRSLHCTLNE